VAPTTSRADISRAAEETLVARLTPQELSRALTAATRTVLAELREHDPALTETLQAPLLRLTHTCSHRCGQVTEVTEQTGPSVEAVDGYRCSRA